MIDTHAHLEDEKFDEDRAQVIERAFENGVEKIINVGAGLGSSRSSVEIAEKNENIFASIGLHPHYFNKHGEKSWDKIQEFEELLNRKKIVAIGEIGLDYFFHEAYSMEQITRIKEIQKKGFIFQLEIAKKNNLPVVIHCRGSKESPSDAYNDCYDILIEFQNGLPCDERSEFYAVFHCYSGNLEFTKKLLNLENVYFSFTGNITYAKDGAEIIKVIETIPFEKIMLETDCPYLAPVPHRGKRNEPAYVSYVCEKIAEIKQISAKEVEKITTQNAINFFNI